MDNGGLLSVSTAAVVEPAQAVDVSRRKQAVLANLLVGESVLEQGRSSDAIAGVRRPINTTLASDKGRQPREGYPRAPSVAVRAQCDASISEMR
jgi:hypothetical protein